MDTQVKGAISKVVEAVANKGIYKAAKYLSPKLVVRASRKLYKGKLASYNEDFEVILIVGKPNFEHREFIKMCKKAGEPFPVKNVQIKHAPKTK